MPLKNIIIALPLEEDLLKPLYHWGQEFNWSEIENVHLIHIVKKSITPLEFGMMEMPDANTYKEMLPPLNRFLADEAKKIIPSSYQGKIEYHLENDFSPFEAMLNFIERLRATLIVVTTRGKHGFKGLFYSSFTDHMVRFAPCDVYVVRPLRPK